MLCPMCFPARVAGAPDGDSDIMSLAIFFLHGDNSNLDCVFCCRPTGGNFAERECCCDLIGIECLRFLVEVMRARLVSMLVRGSDILPILRRDNRWLGLATGVLNAADLRRDNR